MKAQASVLEVLVVVFGVSVLFRHYQIDEFAKAMGLTIWAGNYVLNGLLDAVLAVVICILFWTRGGWIALIATPICVTMFSEGMQMAGCRLLVTDITKVPHGMNLCNYVAGWPIGSFMPALILIGSMLIYGYVYAKQQQ